MDTKLQQTTYLISDNGCERSPAADDDESGDEFSIFTDSLCRPIACIGCLNYQGQLYDEQKLICALHPEGWHDENCPDFSAMNTNEINNNCS